MQKNFKLFVISLYNVGRIKLNDYICKVIFFIVLDLRLTRLGESVLPFFLFLGTVPEYLQNANGMKRSYARFAHRS